MKRRAHPRPTALEVAALAEAIRSHLSANPLAADTVLGIQRWWLLPVFGEVSTSMVEAALDLLESEGAICKTERGWGPAVYRRVSNGGLSGS